MRILSAEQARAVDRRAIDELGVPSLVLMENAAIGVADAIGSLFPAADSVAILCGPGNNGGDGLALARHLHTRGYEVGIAVISTSGELKGDSAVQESICQKLGLEVERVADEEALEAALADAASRDVVVDALFGTGLTRSLEGLYAAAVRGINALGLPCLSVDLPSGLAGGSSEPLGHHVHADVTVTFVGPKIAHIFPPAADAVGELVIADLGVPARWADDSGNAAEALYLLTGEDLACLVPERAPDSNKGNFGHLLIVAGSVGKGGAAILSARSAVRSGAGLVTVGTPEALVATVTAGSFESMTLALPAGAEGKIAQGAAAAVGEALLTRSALAIGPGLGNDDATAEVIRTIVLAADRPAVVDADALNAFAGRPTELKSRTAPTVLTPHPGELGRLLGMTTAAVQADRLGAVRKAVEATGAVVVLKGHLTLVSGPGENGTHVNPTGNPGMATGGTGDVLTGLIGALLAQGLPALDAACLGVFLHGTAGDLALEKLGGHGLAAGDLIEAFPAAWLALTDGDDEGGHGPTAEQGLRRKHSADRCRAC
jgi:hydroxyethylthiazole kinase-like uncharacterized protein yjeF